MTAIRCQTRYRDDILREMNWLGRTACFLALWCLLKGASAASQGGNKGKWTGSTNSTISIGQLQVMGQEMKLRTARSDQYQRHETSSI